MHQRSWSVTICAVKFVKRIFEQWTDSFPIGGGFGLHGVHRGGLLFARLAASFGAHHLRGGKSRSVMKPAEEHDVTRQCPSLASEISENQLGHVLGPMRVAVGASKRDGIDQVYVAFDEFPEGGFGAFICVASQELVVV